MARLPTLPEQTTAEELSSAPGTAPSKISFSTPTFLFFRSPLPKCAPSPELHALFISVAKRARILTAQNSIESRASVLPKRQAFAFSCIATAMKANSQEIPTVNMPWPLTLTGAGQCHLCASCVKCHLGCHPIAGTTLCPMQMKRSLWPRIRGTAIAWTQ